MVRLASGLVLLVVALAACSATPIHLPFADGGTDGAPGLRHDGAEYGDASASDFFVDSNQGPIPDMGAPDMDETGDGWKNGDAANDGSVCMSDGPCPDGTSGDGDVADGAGDDALPDGDLPDAQVTDAGSDQLVLDGGEG